MVYFHGNAATRAAGNRVRTARHLTDLGANFLIIDYRWVCAGAEALGAPPLTFRPLAPSEALPTRAGPRRLQRRGS